MPWARTGPGAGGDRAARRVGRGGEPAGAGHSDPAGAAGRDTDRAFTVVVTILTCLGALAILALLAFAGAPGSLALATVLAVLPVGPLVACYLWLDRYEPEPRTLLTTSASISRRRPGEGSTTNRTLDCSLRSVAVSCANADRSS